jgi:hypothetical protein
MVIDSGTVYPGGQYPQGDWQQQQPPRRGLFTRIGGWFSGVFGRNRQGQGTPVYQNNGQPINGRIYQGPVIQQGPVNTTEPPLPGQGKVGMVVPQGGQVIVNEQGEMIVQQGETPLPAQGSIAQVSHEPAKRDRLDLPVSDKFKNQIGHDANYGWLNGQLYRLQAGANTLWVVRYAGADEQDRHGGSVILAPAVEMQNFREGDLVSVQGQILNEGRSSEHIPCPVYRASEVSLIERGD